jgi:hypothetical protein
MISFLVGAFCASVTLYVLHKWNTRRAARLMITADQAYELVDVLNHYDEIIIGVYNKVEKERPLTDKEQSYKNSCIGKSMQRDLNRYARFLDGSW